MWTPRKAGKIERGYWKTLGEDVEKVIQPCLCGAAGQTDAALIATSSNLGVSNHSEFAT